MTRCTNKDCLSQQKQLNDENKLLRRKIEREYRLYNTTQLIVCLLYAIMSAFMLFFVERGIAVFSALQNKPTLSRFLLDIIVSCLVLPMFGSVIALYYRSYHFAGKDIIEAEKGYCGECDIINDKAKNTIKTKADTESETWIDKLKRHCTYFAEPHIMRKCILCWSIHAISIAVHIAFFCFAIKGVYSIVHNHFPHREWHDAIIYSILCGISIVCAACNFIFYHSVSQMLWWNCNQSCNDQEINPGKFDDSITKQTFPVEQNKGGMYER